MAVDPSSQTSPQHIIDRWNNHHATTNLTIVQWARDEDYMLAHEFSKTQHDVAIFFQHDRPSSELIQHRARQRLFYYKCMLHCQQNNRHWTALIDTDEYMVLRYDTLHDYGRRDDELPTIDQPGSILSFLKSEFQRPDAHPNLTYSPCVAIPRLRFGAKEREAGSSATLAPRHVPPLMNKMSKGRSSFSLSPTFDLQAWETLRWTWHANLNDHGTNRISKTMVDLSRLKPIDIVPVYSIHRPIKSKCEHKKLHIRPSEQVLVLHHYLGTWEYWKYRQDPRQDKERSETVRDVML
jgi:hypothetical protein